MSARTIVFLHIPKTAGQTVHTELTRVIGEDRTSPVRVHTQAGPEDQFPPGYRLYSGHLDWTTLETLPEDRFTFSVLRDPRERIASFYFYLLKKAEGTDAEALQRPEHTGMRTILERSADDYFFGGDARWRTFIRDHYDNFYCTYFATRKMRGWSRISKLTKSELMARARAGAEAVDAFYGMDGLAALEADLHSVLGAPVHLVNTRVNEGPKDMGAQRWPALAARLERDDSLRRLERMAALDAKLMRHLSVA
ncbi:sulfotransferase family protein [Tateyamaria omphalii]|uniref:sulfotransferase family 2 domain-containing protein n=1 Tax=Tateyamaria omphalii TaxID=299262 RepID=UPI001C996FFE|nr:sulfotransferase family 2 domain-containing protein [Tateyamaria omphalii]MBY5935558.1 sulfotransferase family protein [Tateyamaria omphalii]